MARISRDSAPVRSDELPTIDNTRAIPDAPDPASSLTEQSAPRSDVPASLARSARRFASFDVTGESVQQALDVCLEHLASGRWGASELVGEIARLRDANGMPLANEVLMALYYHSVAQPYVVAGLRGFIYSTAEGILPLPPDVRITGFTPDSIAKIADGSLRLPNEISSTWPEAERKILEGFELAKRRETEAERQFERYGASLPDELAHPTSETSFSTYPLPATDFIDTASARSAQRERLGALAARTPDHAVERAQQAYLAPFIALAEEFDLTILDSGNLYHEGGLLFPVGVSSDGILVGLNSEGRCITVSKDMKPPSESGAERKKSTDPVGTAAFLGGLLPLPENYLADLTYAPAPADGWMKERWRARSVEIDMEALGEHELVKAKNVIFTMHAYTVKIGATELRIAIPDPYNEENRRLEKTGYYRAAREDLPDLVEAIRQALPVSLLPKKLKIDLLPLKLKHTQAVTSEGAEVLFSSYKTRSFKTWLANAVLTALQHESVHVLHDGHAGIVALVRRAMALDGWTMQYGDNSSGEYLAVLAENFFDHPQNRHRFPNGYRLFYTLLKMREAGIVWNGKRSAAELDALVAGGKPFETYSSLRILPIKTDEGISPKPPRGVFANWELAGKEPKRKSRAYRPQFKVSREHPVANPLLRDPEDFDPMQGGDDATLAPVRTSSQALSTPRHPSAPIAPLQALPVRTLTLPFVELKLWR